MVEFTETTVDSLSMVCNTGGGVYQTSTTMNLPPHNDTGIQLTHDHVQTNNCSMTSPDSTTNTSSLEGGGGTCAECGEAIIDRFYLFALERRWHNSCLRCCVCRRHLETEGSCYVKDGFIYCKEDYFSRFGAQKCASCFDNIQSGEMVMRAQSNVYHVKCFTCTVCNSILQTGDHFGIFDSKIYCRADFENLQYTVNQSPNSNSPGSMNSMISTTTSGGGGTGMPSCQQALSSHSNVNLGPQAISTPTYDDMFGEYPPPLSHPDFPPSIVQEHQANNGPTKNRSRKRRQGETIMSRPDQQWQIGLTMIDPETGYPSQSQVKQKRMRTSFKHHQLKIMKQYFNLNHNPDAKDLKQLSQKTGLSKRVLQVWFQNARAKYRRGQGDGTKEGSTNEGEENSPNDEGNNSNDDMISDTESNELDSNTSARSHMDDKISSNSPLNNLDIHSMLTSSPADLPSIPQHIVTTNTLETSAGLCL